jgi:GNAT superfamily N-acetyltransferase
MHVIRRASPGDAAALAVLAERTFRDAFAADSSPSDLALHCAQSYSPALQRREIEDQTLVTLLVENVGVLAAFAQVRLHAPHACVVANNPSELARFYVLKRWHGLGIARDLMNRVVETAIAGGSSHLWLGVWERNERAQTFYGKFGFHAVGDHIFRVGTDPQRDLIMVVPLPLPAAP